MSKLYKRIELDLSVAREDEEIDLEGVYNGFYFVKLDNDLSFKVNSKNQDELFTEEGSTGFEGEFAVFKLYISNPASIGKAVLIVY